MRRWGIYYIFTPCCSRRDGSAVAAVVEKLTSFRRVLVLRRVRLTSVQLLALHFCCLLE